MNTLKEKMNRYMDAGFPILYLNTFEEEKADELIKSIIGGRKIMEWSMDGFVDTSEKKIVPQVPESLAETLTTLLEDKAFLERKVLVLKDAHFFLENHPDTPAVVSRLKKLAQLINEGLEGFNIVIVSPVTKIP